MWAELYCQCRDLWSHYLVLSVIPLYLTWRRKVLKLRVLKYLGRILLEKASVEKSTSNPRRHSTMPECVSRISMSCNLLTNLLSLWWLRPPRSLIFLLFFLVVFFEAEYGSGVTGMDPNLVASVSKVSESQAREDVSSSVELVSRLRRYRWKIYSYRSIMAARRWLSER